MAIKIRKGDTVHVIAGDDKGKTGACSRSTTIKMRVVIEKVNFVKRHTKPRRQGVQERHLEREAPIHISNVQLYDPKSGRGTRVGIRVLPGRDALSAYRGERETLRKPQRSTSERRGARTPGSGASRTDPGERETMADDKKEQGAKPRRRRAKPPRPRRSAKAKGEGAKAKPRQGGKAQARRTRRQRLTGAAGPGKPRLAKLLLETGAPALMEKFGYSSRMQAPRFEKIV
jgi:large subunit ribosomal protein L24